ncbi:MAG: YidC/Oxa1 family membrane protein insertase, partial [Clostridia bacterium]|nr:YidC/Oxa1 family membrane protein insertase [Clostridia bacterium]
IGSMLLSQLIMNKEQKAQMELQSVDGGNGQAAQTSKMMMWMMPIMFGIFAFIYTASFSLYLIVSTLFSTASTFIINKIVENNFKKKMEKEEQEKFNKRYSHLRKDKK